MVRNKQKKQNGAVAAVNPAVLIKVKRKKNLEENLPKKMRKLKLLKKPILPASNKDEQTSTLSLAKFEKRLKRKRKHESQEKHPEPENVQSHKNETFKEAVLKKKRKVELAEFSRCSFEELLKFWTDYVQENLSAIEADQLELKKNFVSAVNDADEKCSQFLKTNISGWKEFLQNGVESTSKGAPYILLLCGSAIRAVNLSRDIADFKTEKCKTGKLFAKHIKMVEQKRFLSSHVIHLGVGSPHRIQVLLDEGAMQLTNLHYLVLDWAHLDEKKRRLFDAPYVRKEIFDLIRKQFFPLLESGTLKIVLM